MKRNNQSSFAIVILGWTMLALIGCTARAVNSGSNTQSVISPLVTTLTPPTLGSGEPFTCWNPPEGTISSDKSLNQGQIIIVLGNGDFNLYRFDLSTKQYSLLVPKIEHYGTGRLSAVSPDGRFLWYGEYHDPTGDLIFIYDLIEGRPRQVPLAFASLYTANYPISWSADSHCLIFWQNAAAVAYRLVDGANQRRSFPEADFTYFGGEVVPSADGRWLAWSCRRSICIMNLSGLQIEHEDLKVPVDRASGLIRWSPAENTLAFAYSTDERYRSLDMIRVVHLDNDVITAAQDFSAPVNNLGWSPNGRYLLISEDGGYALRIYDVSTSEIRTLSSVPRYYGMPAWSPNSKQIALISENHHNIYIMNADGTNLTELLPLPLPAMNAGQTLAAWHIFWTP